MTGLLVTTSVNGDEQQFLCAPDETLLDALRNRLGLTGTKEGCGTGDCGACSVTVNGRLVCSCLVLAAEADGAEIGTIEGVATGDRLHPLQEEFITQAALQCGICTPGILVAAKSLLERNPDPSDEEVRYWLAGNLCRCTGYDKIIKAVQSAAARMREERNGV
jgi:aerobic carbon-monoxide dehydrogenase small subunit